MLHYAPDYFEWLDTVTSGDGAANVSSPSPMSDDFIQLPVISGKDATPVPVTDPIISSKVVAIERLTHNQSGSDAWHRHRESRLTASHFHRIVHCQADVHDSFLKSIFSLGQYFIPCNLQFHKVIFPHLTVSFSV